MGAEKNDGSGEIKRPDSWYGARHTQCIMLFILITLSYGMRATLSVGIVAMTNPSANPNPDIPTYQWDDNSVILSSFFWGYVITQVPAGQLAKTYGPKKFLIIATLINSIFCGLIPVMAPLGSWGVILCRVIQGLMQGFIFPSAHTLLGKWAPPAERTTLGSFVYAGGIFGTFLSLIVTGWISGSHFGWPYVFYLYGGLGILWSMVYILNGSNSPAEHPSIDPEERRYIETTLGQISETKVIATPWKDILTSPCVWAIVAGHAGQSWGFWTLLTNIPTYLNSVLKFDLQKNGLLSAGPYFTFWVLSFLFGGVSDTLIKNKVVSVGAARKVANSIGLYVPAAALLVLGIISDSEEGATDIILVLLFIAVGINSASYSGYNVNHIDISPVHAGTLMGITNGIANILSILGPLALQWIVTDTEDPFQWAIVFYISCAIYIIGNTIFVIFASGELQPWNSIQQDDKEDNKV